MYSHPFVLCSTVQLELIQSIVTEVNNKTGEAECQFYRCGLNYLEDSQRLPEIQQSRFLYCHGELKNNKGQVDSASSLPQATLVPLRFLSGSPPDSLST